MSNPTLIKAYDAAAAIAAYRIVKWGAANRKVEQAAGASDLSIGVSDRLGVVAGERVEIVRAGIALVEYGGAVARGDRLTADADGKAVPIDGAGLFQAVVAGKGANADIAVADILKTDLLAGVSATDNSAVTNPTIHANGQIRSTGTTANKNLIVTWRRPVRIIGVAEIAGVDGDIGEALIAPGLCAQSAANLSLCRAPEVLALAQ